MNYLLVIILTNLYWISWIFVGSAILNYLFKYLDNMHLPLSVKVIFSMMLSFFLWSIISLVLYAFKAPPFIAFVSYIIIIVITIIYWSRYKASFKTYIRLNRVAILLLAVLALDFLIITYMGSSLQNGGDAYIHIGRIHAMSVEGYVNNTPYSQFIFDPNYNFNLVYSLYQPMVASRIIDSLDMWRFSSAFFRTMNFIGLYAITGLALKLVYKNKQETNSLTSFITLCIIIAFGHIFLYSTYPSQLAVVWIYTLTISAIYMTQHKKIGALGLLASSLLITLTHPSYALMGALVISSSLIITLIVLKQNITKSMIIFYVSSIFIMLLGPLASYLLSGPLTQQQSSISQGIYYSIGPIILRRFDLLLSGNAISLLFSVLTLIGAVIVIHTCWHNYRKIFPIVITTLLTWSFIMYFPGILNLLLLKLPPWLISRFDAINIFQYTLPFLAIWCIYTYRFKMYSFYIPGMIMITLSFISLLANVSLYKDTWSMNKINYATARELDKLLPRDSASRLDIFASQHLGYQTMSVRRVNLLSVGEGHTVPKADPVARDSCDLALSEIDLDSRLSIASSMGADYFLWDESEDYLRPQASSSKVDQLRLAIIKNSGSTEVIPKSCTEIDHSIFDL